jgi:hypothetical protein
MNSQWYYVIASWVVVLGGLGGYAATVLRKGRALSTKVPEEKRRWM